MIAAAFRITLFSLVLTLLTGILYPFAVTGIAQALFPFQANGSLVEENGKVIGSTLIAQNFTAPSYFHPRPSAAGAGFEANNSGASNLGVTSKALLETYNTRITEQKAQNGETDKIPADAVTASGSGLDPDITPEYALYQANRIAKARNLDIGQVEELVSRLTQGRTFGLFGMPRVNVLALNRELDKMEVGKAVPAE